MSEPHFDFVILQSARVKSGKIRHTFAYSGFPDEKAPSEPSHQDFNFLLR